MEPEIPLILDVVLPALGAGAVAVLATVAVERLGGVAGGIFSSVPTTIVPAAIGIRAGSADDAAFVHAMCFVPLGILLNAAYLLLWRVVPARLGMRSHRWLLGKTVCVSLGAWLAAAAAVVAAERALAPSPAASAVLGASAFAAGLVVAVLANRVPHPAPRGGRGVGAATLVLRGLAAAVAIGLAMALARSGMPVAGGIASVFPAIFTTIMVATWISQGAQVPTGAVGPLMLGTMSVGAYALLAAVLFPRMHVAAASATCWVIAVSAINVPGYLWVQRVRRRHAAAARISE
jgi:hypothetical protein